RVRSSPITSSLIQSVWNASRARWASLTASTAVKQPAVFGRIRTPHRSITSTRPLSPEASIRRSATVTSSVPLALIAFSSASRLCAPPVPRISRDVKVSPPRRNASISTSLGGGEHLDPVTGGDRGGRPRRAGHHLAVDRHGQPAAVVRPGQLRYQVRQRGAGGQVARLSVHSDHLASSCRSWTLCAAGWSACRVGP